MTDVGMTCLLTQDDFDLVFQVFMMCDYIETITKHVQVEEFRGMKRFGLFYLFGNDNSLITHCIIFKFTYIPVHKLILKTGVNVMLTI